MGGGYCCPPIFRQPLVLTDSATHRLNPQPKADCHRFPQPVIRMAFFGESSRSGCPAVHQEWEIHFIAEYRNRCSTTSAQPRAGIAVPQSVKDIALFFRDFGNSETQAYVLELVRL